VPGKRGPASGPACRIRGSWKRRLSAVAGGAGYRYQGRADDKFKVSGIWVSPFEVEAALMSHPAVEEAAVIGRMDEDGLTKPTVFIVLKDPGVDAAALHEELRAHVKATAGLWKYPRWIEVVEDLPRTVTGKIQRFKLRASVTGQA